MTLIILIGGASSVFAEDDEHEKCSGDYNSKIAIFISPTDSDIERQKKSLGDDFYVVADDQLYYQWNAEETFKENNFPHCFTKLKKHKFKMIDGTKKVIDSKCAGWCLVLWNGKDEPIKTGAVELFMYYQYLDISPRTSQ